MTQHQVTPLLEQFGLVFTLCKYLGLYPYDAQAFRTQHTLKSSKVGAYLVIVALILVSVCYNFLIYSFADEDRSLKESQSTLTYVIGLFLTYIGLVMMGTDQVTAIRNQNSIGELYDRIRALDERLYKENVIVDDNGLAARIRALILICFSCEIFIMLSTYVVLVDYSSWLSLLWVFSCLPTLYNTLDKIWFAVSLIALRKRFKTMNLALEELVESHERFLAWLNSDNTPGKLRPISNVGAEQFNNKEKTQYNNKYGFLQRELQGFKVDSGRGSGHSRVAPITNSFGENVDTTPQKQPRRSKGMNMAYESELNNITKTEEKLNNICQAHDELCEIGKSLNDLWSFPILVLMGYGFLIFTAQLYFLYCATQAQAIPSLFRSAKNAIITTVYLSYTSGKCVYLIYLSWKTSLECKRTGICIHKVSVVVDSNSLYEIINHLSLKLLNHSADFSACGFFSLDMETLFGVCGGITSYLIILIQFNLAAQQAKEAVRLYSGFNDTANIVAIAQEGNMTTMWDIINTTMATSTWNTTSVG